MNRFSHCVGPGFEFREAVLKIVTFTGSFQHLSYFNFFEGLFLYFYFMCMNICLHVCIYYMHVQARTGFGFLRTGVVDAFQVPCVC